MTLNVCQCLGFFELALLSRRNLSILVYGFNYCWMAKLEKEVQWDLNGCLCFIMFLGLILKLVWRMLQNADISVYFQHFFLLIEWTLLVKVVGTVAHFWSMCEFHLRGGGDYIANQVGMSFISFASTTSSKQVTFTVKGVWLEQNVLNLEVFMVTFWRLYLKQVEWPSFWSDFLLVLGDLGWVTGGKRLHAFLEFQ